MGSELTHFPFDEASEKRLLLEPSIILAWKLRLA
jgi:hypothetical protein